jgi:REP-associated tyrosine transposase
MPDRLKRLDVVYQHSPIYFVTACTANRQNLLATEAIHTAFKSFAGSGPTYGAWVGAYVLMPDHLHLFVTIDDQQIRMPAWMKSLKGRVSSELRTAGYIPPYWQKGFFDHVLRSGESYSEKWSYVRDNPVRAGLAKSWREWPYGGEIFGLEFHNARF